MCDEKYELAMNYHFIESTRINPWNWSRL